MSAEIDEKFLDEKLEALEKQRAWSPRTVAKIESLIRAQDEFALFRVNPIKFAAEKNVPEQEALDLFLHATKIGLFQMNWNVLCPGCGAVVENFEALKTVHSDSYCYI
jgi:hypothetical protein